MRAGGATAPRANGPGAAQEADVARLGGMEAAFGALEARARDAEARASQLEGRVALLETERGHLARQLRAAEERVGSLAREAAAREDKVWLRGVSCVWGRLPVERTMRRALGATLAQHARGTPPASCAQIAELKRTRAELYAKLRAAATAGAASDSGRIERELARLQAAAATDLEAAKRCARCGPPGWGGAQLPRAWLLWGVCAWWHLPAPAYDTQPS